MKRYYSQKQLDSFKNFKINSVDYEKQRAVPRPGHADFVASSKFKGFEDYRGGGHFSGRLTACLVAAGVVAKKVLASANTDKQIVFTAKLVEAGGEADNPSPRAIGATMLRDHSA